MSTQEQSTDFLNLSDEEIANLPPPEAVVVDPVEIPADPVVEPTETSNGLQEAPEEED